LCHEICCWLMIYAIFLIPHVLASVSLLKTQRDHQVLQNALLHGNLAPSNFFLIFFSHFDLNLFKYKELELSCSLWFVIFLFFFYRAKDSFVALLTLRRWLWIIGRPIELVYGCLCCMFAFPFIYLFCTSDGYLNHTNIQLRILVDI
jgi:hypothetical protein